MSITIQNLSDIEKLESQSLETFKLPENTYEMLQKGASIKPEKLALRFFLQGTSYEKSRDFSYRELIGSIRQTANMLRALGIKEKDVVSFVLPNLPETHFVIWGGEIAGIVNPINPLLEPQQMADIMNAAGTKVLVTLAPFPQSDLWDKLSQVMDQIPSLKTVLTINLAHYLGGVKKVLVNLTQKKARKSGLMVMDFHQSLSKFSKEYLEFKREIKGEDIASYFHTGGTTGTPKLAQHTHASEVFDAWSAGLNLGGSEEQVLFCGLPLFHVNGVIVTGLIPWSQGASVVLGSPQGYRGAGVIPNFWKIVEHYKINFFSGVPTVYQMLLDVPIKDQDISSLEYAICGAAPMPVELFKSFQERTGVNILEGYGLTEGTCASSCNPAHGEKKIGSIGLRIPFQEMKTMILDENGQYQRAAEVDEIGAVVLRGPNIFKGYKDEMHNQNVFIDDGDGKGTWLNTGDLGRQDQDGYFWLTGRLKELIIRGGHNIDPKIIEEPLHLHPDIALAAAVGRPDPRVGEVPVVYVQLNPGAKSNEEEILAFAKERIGERAAHPKALYFIEEMPVTAVGKIFKPQLSWWQIEEVYQMELSQIPEIELKSVKVQVDKLKGKLAYIQVKSAKKREEVESLIDARLGAYSIAYEISLTS